ncbi:protease IV [Dendrobium catenatum]|uniref:Protease IV n=1 Tax=Dendrobium catenatum TaxID=906689 RepID=A0A2I0XC71_9ASPA|nr:protease IV [Dendrobium catenatum]
MAGKAGEYPTGEFEMVEFGWWMKAMVKLRMVFALPWERVKKGSVLSIKLRGRVGFNFLLNKLAIASA